MLDKTLFVWILLFILGVVIGVAAYRQVLPLILPLLKTEIGTAAKLRGLKAFSFIFFKNAFVVLLCILWGKITKGIFPALVCFLNGTVLGFIGAVLVKYGHIAWWKYAAALLPHGVIELAAVFLGCSIGIASLTRWEKLQFSKYPLAMLVLAACIETWVSAAIAKKIL